MDGYTPLEVREYPESNFTLSPIEKHDNDELRVFCWNIERGYLLDGLIAEMRVYNPDILLLQEVDIGNERTNNKDCVLEIALGLGMKYCVFGVEFQEIYSEKRSKLLQGGGHHGNAIISRFPITNAKCIHLPMFHNWGNSSTQPRIGNRIAVSGLVKTNLGDITCISVHLENQCSPIGRRKQMECLVRKLSQFEDYPETTIIGGDMNTVCTGLARFYAVNIFSWNDICERICTFGCSESTMWLKTMSGIVGPTGIYSDPFDHVKDYTISQLWGLFTAKIDWLLASNIHLSPVHHSTGGNYNGSIGNRLSDHKWIACVYKSKIVHN